MVKDGDLVIDGVEFGSFKHEIKTMPGSGNIPGGRLWARPDIIDTARKGTQLLLDGRTITFSGEYEDGSFDFGVV